MKKVIFGFILSLVSTISFSQVVNGAGATFPAPLYAKWADVYNKETNVKINYASVGSGAGIRQIEARTVVFGASDMPLTDEKLKSMNAIQFPTVIGGVVPVINLKNVQPGEMRLTGHVLAEIYLGKITKWNDPQIKALNPKLNLPDEQIMPIRRADGSGTTFIFTNYLSKIHPEFKNTIGEGTAVNWKVGAGGRGNEGVSAFVNKLPNSIGYVEYAYVKQNKMNFVQVQNSSGNWVLPDDLTFKAAASKANWNESFYQILTNQSDKNAWPITGATFIIMPLVSENPKDSQEAIKFFIWAFEKGDKMAEELDYVPLPDNVVARVKQQLSIIK